MYIQLPLLCLLIVSTVRGLKEFQNFSNVTMQSLDASCD